ncbi:MAG: peptide ABC transporter substrate-binding protein [Oscillospiraceae bacterium]|jgi:oligopeptide transport system substrate-binding protein|nr:peptide ABC transporter substrate-binding protein [Oscillospiraceae bacterium]
MKIKRALLLLLAIAMMFTLFACKPAEPTADDTGDDTVASNTDDTGDDTAEPDDTADAPVGEAKIIYALIDDPEEMNPTLNTYSRSSNVLQQLFRGLYKFDSNNQLVPALAEGYTVDETSTVYTFTLKSGLKWSDGSPLTANDFEYAWKLLLNPETASGAVSDFYTILNAKEYNDGIATADDVGIKALDDLTLEVKLTSAIPWFVSQTATTSYMPVSKAIVEQYGLDWAKTPEHYVSSGPYMLTAINSKEKVSMAKNPNYYAADEVKIDAIDIMIIPDQETQAIAFENGELSLNGDPTPQLRSQYEGTSQLIEAPRAGERHLDVNTTDTVNPQFQDARVRLALAMTINRKQIVENVLRTTETPLLGFVPYSQPSLVEPDKDYRDVVGNAFEEDIAAAQQLLADAGYPNGEGFPVFRLICQSNQTQKDIAQALQSMWKENLGIDCEIITYEKGYWDELENDNFDVGFCGWTDDYLDPHAHLKIWAIGGNEYECNWNVPLADGSYVETQLTYTDLINQSVIETDPAKREAILREAEALVTSIMPSIPVYSYKDYIVTQANLHGVQKNYIGHINFEFAYFD